MTETTHTTTLNPTGSPADRAAVRRRLVTLIGKLEVLLGDCPPALRALTHDERTQLALAQSTILRIAKRLDQS